MCHRRHSSGRDRSAVCDGIGSRVLRRRHRADSPRVARIIGAEPSTEAPENAWRARLTGVGATLMTTSCEHRAVKRTLALSLIFIVGCVAGATTAQLVVPKARAGATFARWEYHCVDMEKGDVSKMLNPNGREGWELVTLNASGFGTVLGCFKRPLG